MRETPLEPDIPICDAHHHLVTRPDFSYSLEDYLQDIGSDLNVRSTVYVECGTAWRTEGPESHRPVGETEYAAAEARRSMESVAKGPVIEAIVGHADLRAPDIRDVLQAHIEAGHGRFRGIRQVIAYDESPELNSPYNRPSEHLLSDPAFRAGLVALGRSGLSFDAYLYHTQLIELVSAARAAPETVIVIDHIGTPLGIGPYAGRRKEVSEVWRKDMELLSQCDNTVVKLGGIGMPIFGFDWHLEDTHPTSEEVAKVCGSDIRWCLETFGADRCMFESNFPVDKRSFDYSVLWNAFKRIVEGASTSEKRSLFYDNACQVYRIPS